MTVVRSTQLQEEHEDRYAKVVKKHKLLRSNAITWMKHKHIYLILAKGTCMDGVSTVVII